MYIKINQFCIFIRSSEEALDVLLKFMEMRTRETIHKQLATKFDLVMRQFIKEITAVEDKFTVSATLVVNSVIDPLILVAS